ncbi:MAG: hypothetical protein OXH65_05170 [Paracoccaceae bacterium]|nr:hypothetical protein [Paracoccaceae bacterium]
MIGGKKKNLGILALLAYMLGVGGDDSGSSSGSGSSSTSGSNSSGGW